jgi:hypothetical protein
MIPRWLAILGLLAALLLGFALGLMLVIALL